jgi:hypothetical protein
MNSSVPSRACWEQSTSLPGRRSFFVADLRAVSFSAAAAAFLGAQHEEIEDRAGGLGVAGQPVVEMVAHGGLDHAGGLGRGEAVLGLAHEFRLRDEAGDQRAAAARQVVAGDVAGLLVAQLAIGADALEDRGPEPGLVRAALGRRDVLQ